MFCILFCLDQIVQMGEIVNFTFKQITKHQRESGRVPSLPVDPVHVRSCNACQTCVNHLPLRQPVTGFSAKIIVFFFVLLRSVRWLLHPGFKLFCFAFVQHLSTEKRAPT